MDTWFGRRDRSRLRRLGRRLSSETEPRLTRGFRELQAKRALPASLRMRVALGIGVLALMTLKPGATGAAGIVALATVAGLAAVVVGMSGGSVEVRRAVR